VASPASVHRRLEGSELTLAEGARLLAPAEPTEAVTVRVCLRPRPDGPALPDHDHWMATPPGRRRFLSAEEFAARHGACEEDIAAIASFAETYGLDVIEIGVASRAVVLRGAVENVSRAFAVELGRYESPAGTYLGHEGPIHLPEDVVDRVVAVFGLDTRPVAYHNGAGDPPGTAPLILEGPTLIAQLYDFPSPTAHISGQTIGIIEFSDGTRGGWVMSDITTTLQNWGVTLPAGWQPVDVPVTGNSGEGEEEATLDICVASAIAPGAAVRVYWGALSAAASSWSAILGKILHETTPPSVLTSSWALANADDTSTNVSASQMKALSMEFQGLAARGVTVIAACGDDGARSFTKDGKAHVQYPGSDPWLTSCGGTTVSDGPFEEWVWNDTNATGEPQATGGGVSRLFTAPLPAWQQVVDVPLSLYDGTTAGRGVPDVAGNASLQSGYYVTVNDKSVGPLCGTSAVAPLYAGLMAIVNARLGYNVGFLNPTLYAFRDTVCRDIDDKPVQNAPLTNGVPAFTNQIGSSYPAVAGYPSGPGWDACTGLGVIDGGALLAALQAVATQSCELVIDRSEIGEAEVSATLQGATPGVIANVLYVVLDGFSAADLGITSADLSGTLGVVPQLTVAGAGGLQLKAGSLLAEDTSLPATPQRFTWVCEAVFDTDLSAFAAVTDAMPRDVTVTAAIHSLTSAPGVIELAAEADPYELDGPVPWLSTDLRVFQLEENGSLPGLPGVTLHNTGNPKVDAPTFIKATIGALNASPDPLNAFDSISTDEQTSAVTLNQYDFTLPANPPIYNFALMRVRYQSDVPSGFVRVFFRLYQAATTSTAYEPNTYATVSNAAVSPSGKIPVFGVNAASEVVAIPCFADARVAAGADLDTQTDEANVMLHGIQPATDKGVAYTYFGCWLDINQPNVDAVPLPPVAVDSSTPWAHGSQSVLAAIRGKHQCLIAEISYDADPAQLGQTPASSDKLAQRNLTIVPSANPGNPASHQIAHTFAIRPTLAGLSAGVPVDELMIRWGSAPAGSVATLYLPGVNVAEILELASEMYVTQQLSQVDAHTLRCRAEGVTWIPVPQAAGGTLAGLLTVQLPANVRKGDAYTIVVQQVTNATVAEAARDGSEKSALSAAGTERLIRQRRVLGSFQLTIPVAVEEQLLEPEERLLAIMHWIDGGIPAGDIWSPVIERYIAQIAARVHGFGGDPARISPSPTGALATASEPWDKRHEHGFTGKVQALLYDRFGDFCGFVLLTEQGREHRFDSTEAEVQALVARAWECRTVITVVVDRQAPRSPALIVLRRSSS
jgi:hypothetical protein